MTGLLEQGLALHRAGRLVEARTVYEQVLAREPSNFDALQLLGMIAAQTRDYARAADYLGRAGLLQPADAALQNNLGFVLKEQGRLSEALAHFDRAVALKPDYAKAHNHRGLALAGLGQGDAAIAAYDRAIVLEPGNPEYHSNRGSALAGLRRFDDAIAAFDRAIALNPGYPPAHNNRGNALADSGRLEEALGAYDRALALHPDYADAHSNRAAVLLELDRTDEALAAYDAILARDPADAAAWCHRGVALSQMEDAVAALDSFDRALALDPGHDLALQNRGMALLTLGRFAEGWPLFAHRAPEPKTAAVRSKPLWAGGDARGKRILVHFERGLGDTIQFCRYVPLLAAQGAEVIFAPQPALKALMAGLDLPLGDLDAAADWQCPVMSLPLVLDMASIPPAPYLSAESARVARWRDRIGAGGFRIGICWQGEPRKNDRGRSFPLAAFAGLAAMPGVRLISLHKGVGEAQLAAMPPGMAVETLDGLDAGPDAFLDTAAAMTVCDLIVTSDTSIAHLAGALGRPVWVALKHAPDWRWLLNRTDSPWYASMRLFRQPAPGDWRGVFAAMAAALAEQRDQPRMLNTT